MAEGCLLHRVAPWYVTYDTRFYPGPYRQNLKTIGVKNRRICTLSKRLLEVRHETGVKRVLPLSYLNPIFHFTRGVKHRLPALICSVRSLSSTGCNFYRGGAYTVVRVALDVPSAPNIGANIFPAFFLSTA